MARQILALGCVGLAFVGAATSAMAQSATRTRLLSLDNPSAAGAPVRLRAEIDGLGGGAPTGWATFWDGATRLGYGKLSATGAGQATLSIGFYHGCGITSARGLRCWGGNWKGQLGDGTRISPRLIAVDVVALSDAVAVATGSVHSCALSSSGEAKCWGDNEHGQLGDRTTANKSAPIQVFGLTDAVSIGAGSLHNCAVTRSGGVKCWGYNRYGQLGDGTRADHLKPREVLGVASGAVAVSAGSGHSCALTAAGGVKCWGGNLDGELGDGTTTQRLTPVAVAGLSSGVVAIAAGRDHSCAVTLVGGLKCWGYNGRGQLGDGTTTDRLAPVDVPGLTNDVVAVAAGWRHTCALTSAGGVKCWGYNGQGQLGDGTTTDRLAPVDVPGLTNGVVAISATTYNTCASTSAGGVVCWGRNNFGQIGDGTTIIRYTPTATHNLSPVLQARAEFTTPPLAGGDHWMKAYYRGDATHAPSLGGMRQKVQ